MNDAGEILLITFEGGGNVPPMVALGQRLARRGHKVRVLGSPSLEDRVADASLDFRPFVRVPEWDPAQGRAIEDQVIFFFAQLAGPEIIDDVLAELDRRPTNALVIDCMQIGALNAGEHSHIPRAVLVHYMLQASAELAEGFKLAIPIVNVSRDALGLELLDTDIPLHDQLWARCNRTLVAGIAELDEPPEALPANLRYVGPIFEPDSPGWEWDLPWPPDHPDPLVLVSFSTTYQHQEHQLQRCLEALASLPVRTLATLGPSLAPGEIDAPPNAVVRQWIPHAAVLPHAAVVVTHAGHSTVMNTLAHGVPLVCIPTGRDQPVTARRVQTCGAGTALDPDADLAHIRDAVTHIITTPTYRAAAQQLATTIREAIIGEPAVTEVEWLLSERSDAASEG